MQYLLWLLFMLKKTIKKNFVNLLLTVNNSNHTRIDAWSTFFVVSKGLRVDIMLSLFDARGSADLYQGARRLYLTPPVLVRASIIQTLFDFIKTLVNGQRIRRIPEPWEICSFMKPVTFAGRFVGSSALYPWELPPHIRPPPRSL